jgi:hypothetical protein
LEALCEKLQSRLRQLPVKQITEQEEQEEQ